MRDRRRSRGAMSVEYALLLVVITGAVIGMLSLDVTKLFKTAECAIEAALNGGSCDGGTVLPPDPTTPELGPAPTGAPTTQPPITADPSPSCEPTSSQTRTTPTSGSDGSASDCPTTTSTG
jgi:Flp pilus assembly pilin Flp